MKMADVRQQRARKWESGGERMGLTLARRATGAYKCLSPRSSAYKKRFRRKSRRAVGRPTLRDYDKVLGGELGLAGPAWSYRPRQVARDGW